MPKTESKKQASLSGGKKITVKTTNYDHRKIEKKQQKIWDKNKLYQTSDKSNKPKCYILDMFPYPSGEGLHVGHVEGYTATDIYSRFKRMNGFNVLHPMGWDAFGLPAENYAIKNKVNPEISTKKNVDNFRRQLKNVGFSYDWGREINTTDPKYYKWTQWIFLQLYKKGLAYESFEPINWCPSCQTGLANEDLEDGKCERCGSIVEKKPMHQWVLKITDYAERLLSGLPKLSWPESVKESQRNWIGKSEGAEIDFEIDRKYNFVLIHGFKSDSTRGFFPWLKNELEDRGHRVMALDLPEPFTPDIEKQAEYILKNIKFDNQTIIVGHSLGTVVTLKVLEKLKQSVHKTILVAGLLNPDLKKYGNFLPKVMIDWRLDFSKIKTKMGELVILRDLNDDVIGDGQCLKIQKELGGRLIEVEAHGAHFRGKIEPAILEQCLEKVKIFTTRPDTLYGATYLVLAPEHPIVEKYLATLNNTSKVKKYIKATLAKTEIIRTAEGKEKTGVLLDSLRAINPANNESLPVYIADYVLPDYGTGAIMAVPAHDERDWLFAQKFGLPKRVVVWPDQGGINLKQTEALELVDTRPYLGDGYLIDSGEFSGLDSEKAKIAITRKTNGRWLAKYKLRDWVFSRQRYWGEPIPIIHCEKCGIVPVPEKDLPVRLPKVKSYAPTGTGESPLADIKSWVNVKCPKCGAKAKRETNTMPQWAGSSWYYLRFLDSENNKELVSRPKADYWLSGGGVDMYVGGVEHATRHLIYARFWHKFLYDLGLVKDDEPFHQLKHQGLILGEDGRQMRKRWGSVINPDDVVRDYGADTLRIYEMFMGPFEQSIPWSTGNLIGSRRFLDRVFRLSSRVGASRLSGERLGSILERSIKKVGEDIETFSFNTGISTLMVLSNKFEELAIINLDDWKIFLRLLAPFAPHLAEELWARLGQKKSIHLEVWPKFDSNKLVDNEVKVAVQINGKTRGQIVVPVSADELEVRKAVQKDRDLEKWFAGKTVTKVFFVQGKIINLIVV